MTQNLSKRARLGVASIVVLSLVFVSGVFAPIQANAMGEGMSGGMNRGGASDAANGRRGDAAGAAIGGAVLGVMAGSAMEKGSKRNRDRRYGRANVAAQTPAWATSCPPYEPVVGRLG